MTTLNNLDMTRSRDTYTYIYIYVCITSKMIQDILSRYGFQMMYIINSAKNRLKILKIQGEKLEIGRQKSYVSYIKLKKRFTLEAKVS